MIASDCTTDFDRDLRSANRELKRDRDLAAKWMYGARPLNYNTTLATSKQHNSDQWEEKTPTMLRPRKKMSDQSHPFKQSQNVNKRGANYNLPPGRIRAASHAKEEIQDASLARSIVDLLPKARVSHSTASLFDGFSQTDVPTTPQPLSIFVKVTGRETEKLVEKEYEVLDDNGQALKGRKARYNLRHGNSQNPREDEGFELL